MANSRQIRSRYTAGSVVITALFHTIGVSLVFVTMVALTVSVDVAVSVAALSWGNEWIQDAVLLRALIQLGLAISLWTMGYLIFKALDLGRMARRTPRVVRRARGSVMTETIIVLPVLLLLILGMAQLTLNNMASILKQVASFEAARTAWLWVPEHEADNSVSMAEVENRVQIAAALAMTPVATSNYPAATNSMWTDRAAQMEEVMVSRFQSSSSTTGAAGANRMSVVEGLDGNTNQAVRARKKFRHAYHSVESVEIHTGEHDGLVGATIVYQHAQGMPLVGGIFGEQRGGGVYYREYEISMKIPAQLYDVCRPGECVPESSSFWGG